MLISLHMHCFYCILTSLISQALLQALLDKKERDFTGWFSQYEFSGITRVREVARSTTTVRAMPIVLPTIGNHRNKASGIPVYYQALQSVQVSVPAVMALLPMGRVPGTSTRWRTG
jgi:hypothetical protein